VKGLVFDLDGTLLETTVVTLPVVAEAVRRLGLPELSEAEICRVIGLPVGSVGAALLPPALRHRAAALEALVGELEEQAYRRGEGRLYPEVVATLAELDRRGVKLALFSNGAPDYLAAVGDAFGLRRWLNPYRCVGERAGLTKPVLLREVLAARGLSPAEAVVMGDRRHDAEAAAVVGAGYLGAGWGYAAPDELAGHRVLAGFAELLTL